MGYLSVWQEYGGPGMRPATQIGKDDVVNRLAGATEGF